VGGVKLSPGTSVDIAVVLGFRTCAREGKYDPSARLPGKAGGESIVVLGGVTLTLGVSGLPSLSDPGDGGTLARRCSASASARGFLSPPLSARSRRNEGSLDAPEEERRCVAGGVLGSSSDAVDAVESELQDPLDPTESSENRFSGVVFLNGEADNGAGVIGSFVIDDKSLIDGFRPRER
jgi:hypothetical protein